MSPEILLAQRMVPDDTCVFLSGLPIASYKTLALTTQKRMVLNMRQWVPPEVSAAKCNAPSRAAGWPRDTAREQATQLTAPSPAAPGPASPSTAQTLRSSPKQTGDQTPAAERGTGTDAAHHHYSRGEGCQDPDSRATKDLHLTYSQPSTSVLPPLHGSVSSGSTTCRPGSIHHWKKCEVDPTQTHVVWGLPVQIPFGASTSFFMLIPSWRIPALGNFLPSSKACFLPSPANSHYKAPHYRLIYTP